MADANYIPEDRVITRKQAKELGLKRYFNGKACPQGHISDRLTINGACCECSRLARNEIYWNNRDEELRKQKVRRDSDPDHAAKQKARAHARDPERAKRAHERDADHAARDFAAARGDSQYLSPRSCNNCGTNHRFTLDGKCVECNRIACKARNDRKVASDPKLLAARLARETAILEKQRKDAERAVQLIPYKLTRINRKLAFMHGLNTYYAFRPCRHGHVGMRYTDGGNCLQCSAEFSASEEKKAYDREYLKKNYSRIKERTDLYRAANREQMALKSAEWRRLNPEKRRAIANNYKYKRRAQEESGMTSAELLAWKRAQKKVCYWCGAKCPKKYHVDHYTPLSKGGKHEASNLVIACPTCNLTKSAKDPYEFAGEVGRLF